MLDYLNYTIYFLAGTAKVGNFFITESSFITFSYDDSCPTLEDSSKDVCLPTTPIFFITQLSIWFWISLLSILLNSAKERGLLMHDRLF